MRKVLIPWLLIFGVFFSLPPVAYAQPLNLDYAQSCILIDSKTGQVLYEYKTDEKHVYPASTTKIMTAILALEKGKPDQMMTASRSAVYEIGEGGMNIGINEGEKLRMEDLLNALLISSANETANIIAENICPTRSEFVALMNAKAKELGANDTHFVNTCGIHDPDHYTTAGDLAKIARYAMSIPEFRNIVAKKSYTLPPTNKHDSWPALPVSNYALLNYKSDFFSRINGIKTGYTSEAGHNLVTSAVDDASGMELIAVVLGVKGNIYGTAAKKKCQDYSVELLEYGFKNYSVQRLVGANQFVKTVPVADSSKNTGLDLLTADELSCTLPKDKNEWNVVKEEHIEPDVKAPVRQGDVLGYIEYKRNGVLLGKVNLIASRDVEKSLGAKITDGVKDIFKNSWFLRVIASAALALVLLGCLRFILRRLSRTVKAKKRQDDE
ncbi:MAG: D-alanyl-D-alanine carboxypeptidase family protein [Clostridiales bacterium]|jgi:D-alanyl-D-alanine carboxypeptidase/D-alanyl-D-alanine carboxypeptidase (penicillin-binding protein 5/6)|nr:D-alanyl-D-alanine carboxypeptidase [Eubacteriales bacterium]MDH7565552.1 D-alanyl-D-alanine carboxypeptidase family protein [Clostridiales bacterium]